MNTTNYKAYVSIRTPDCQPRMTEPMETQIQLYDKIQDPIVAIEKLGTFFARSGMFGCTKAEQGMVLAMMCLARRLDPLTVAATWHIMDMGNRIMVSMKYDAMLAKLRTDAGGDYEVIARTPERAEIAITDKKGKRQTFCFTWEEAQKEPFVWKIDPQTKKPVFKDKWATARGRMQMLWARVVSDGVRVMAPEVNFGTYVPEEAEEGPAEAPSVITVESSSDVQGTRAPVEPQSETQPAPAEKAFQASAGPDGKLTVETMLKLANSIPMDLADAATGWLIHEGWLRKGEEWNTLSVTRAQRILNNVSGFCAAVEGWRSAQKNDAQEGGLFTK